MNRCVWIPSRPTSAPAGLATDWRTTPGTALVRVEVIPHSSMGPQDF